MQSSNAPNKIQLPFAASGTKNTIPVPSQQGITPGAASFTDGFPPLTFTPLSAGGVPPAGADFNGILNAITTLQQWQSAGGPLPFDAGFASAIGGYPKGAVITSGDLRGQWISLLDNNTSNPDTGGSGWIYMSPYTIQSNSYNISKDTGSANSYVANLYPAPLSLVAGLNVIVTNITASNTGASTLNVNGFGALPIVDLRGAAMAAGQIRAGSMISVVMNSTGTQWVLGTDHGAFVNVQVFTSSGTYTPSPGTMTVILDICGGGGAGGGAQATNTTGAAGAGGNAGAAIRCIQAVAGAVSVVVGSGGVGSAGAQGGTGGTSSWGAISAGGGIGGPASSGSVAAFSLTAMPQNTFPAVSTQYVATYLSSQFGGAGFAGANSLVSGAGGASEFGSGAPSVGTTASLFGSAGMQGVGYGAGGSGAAANGNNVGVAGGAGLPGIVIIYEYS